MKDLEAKARELCATILQGSGYWLEASPEHISEGAASHMAEALKAAHDEGWNAAVEVALQRVTDATIRLSGLAATPRESERITTVFVEFMKAIRELKR